MPKHFQLSLEKLVIWYDQKKEGNTKPLDIPLIMETLCMENTGYIQCIITSIHTIFCSAYTYFM